VRPNDFNPSIRSAFQLIRDLGLVFHARNFTSLTASDEFKAAALSHQPYELVYRMGLEKRDYNFILVDFAYFQFSYAQVGQLYEVRYGYYPNPYQSTTYDEFLKSLESEPNELDQPPDKYELYVQYLNEQPIARSAPPLRYDIDFGAYRELEHPTAHLHFGEHHDNRWPVAVELTPHAFTLHVMKMFYGTDWMTVGARGEGEMNEFDERFCNEKKECRAIEKGFFSDSERAQLYFC
jgi:hypothetical protein